MFMKSELEKDLVLFQLKLQGMAFDFLRRHSARLHSEHLNQLAILFRKSMITKKQESFICYKSQTKEEVFLLLWWWLFTITDVLAIPFLSP